MSFFHVRSASLDLSTTVSESLYDDVKKSSHKNVRTKLLGNFPNYPLFDDWTNMMVLNEDGERMNPKILSFEVDTKTSAERFRKGWPTHKSKVVPSFPFERRINVSEDQSKVPKLSTKKKEESIQLLNYKRAQNIANTLSRI